MTATILETMPTVYSDFLAAKEIAAVNSGFLVDVESLNPLLFDWQKQLVRWALRKGKSAMFADCGLGKTFMEMEWSRKVYEQTGGDVLILAPLAVTAQTKREADKFGENVTVCRTQADVKPGVNVTNYEMLEHFDPLAFAGVVLDESSIIKSYTGRTRQVLTDSFSATPYKLAASATPAPNDHLELGTHAEFLGVMKRTEMLATFFTHDGGDTSKWVLKGHGEKAFWKWVCSWAVMLRNPSDIGYAADRYILPPIQRFQHTVSLHKNVDGFLFTPDVLTLDERRQVRRDSLPDRVAKAAALVNNSVEQWVVWCDLNDESAALKAAIPDAVEVKGSDSNEHKEKSALGFADGSIRVLVSKSAIYGFGMNWQNCRNVAFVGLVGFLRADLSG
jgi:hypothetical protein